MNADIAVNIGRWYLRWDKGEIFQVAAQDPASGRITVRSLGGDIRQLSLDDWRNLRPGPAETPAAATGPIKRILVALKEVNDGSPAVVKATQIARATGAQIELFHCVDAQLSLEELATYRNGIDEFETAQRRSWEEGLERLAVQVRGYGVPVSVSAPVDHPIHEAIVRQARRFHADLIVTDAHAGSNFAPALTQEVDWELIRMSAAPVLIVRQHHLYRHPIILAALDPAKAHSKPVTLDERILSVADVISKALNGQLHAMHAYTVPAAYAEAGAVVSPGVAAELQAIDAGRAQAALDGVLEASEIPAERRHLCANSAADAIISTATRLNASLVVMGSVGRSGLSGFFIGNTAERVINRLPCDLLLLKPTQFATSISDQRRGPRLISVGIYT